MHVKKLIVDGFKTYRDRVEIIFDKRANAIVGLNGSGKSNLMLGLRYILSDVPGRDELLHTGMGSACVQATVEVHLDNTDRRIAVYDSDLVVVERRIFHKKEEFVIQSKKVTKQEYFSLMESVGFSKSNPYFIVGQGKVQDLTVQTDEARMRLLTEIAGTRSYDERKAAALVSLEEATQKTMEVDSMLEIISKRVDELKEEQSELEAYQILDSEIKAVEGAILERRCDDTRRTIEKLVVQQEDAEASIGVFEEKMEGLEAEIRTQSEELATNAKEYEFFDSKYQEMAEAQARVSQNLEKLNAEQNERNYGRQHSIKRHKANEDEIKTLSKKQSKEEDKISQMAEKTSTLRSTLEETETKRDQLKAQQTSLRLKSGRRELPEEARRNQCQEEVKNLEIMKSKEIKQSEYLQEKVRSMKESLTDVENAASVNVLRQSLEERRAQNSKEAIRLKEAQSRVAEEVRTLNGASMNLDRKKQILLSKKKNLDDEVYKTVNENHARGIKEAYRYEGPGVYGTLLENIQVEEIYDVAIESAAGGQLMNVLVEDNSVATDVVRHIKRYKAGSATLTPLKNVARIASVRDLPEGGGFIPMTDLVQADPKYEPAVRQVFGNYLLVENRDYGNRLRKYGFDCVTVEGDIVSSRGTLSGGYAGRTNRIRTERERRGVRVELKETEDKSRETAKTLDGLRQKSDDVYLRLTMVTREKEKLKIEMDSLSQKIATSGVHDTGVELSELEGRLSKSQSNIESISSTILELRKEIMTLAAGESTQSENQPNELPRVESELKSIEEEIKKIKKNLNKAHSEHQAAASSFQLDVLRRLEDLRSETYNIDDVFNEDEATKLELERAEADLQHITEEFENAERDRDEKYKKVQKLETVMEALTESQSKLSSDLKHREGQLQDTSAQILVHKRALEENERQAVRRTARDDSNLRPLSSKDLMIRLSKAKAKMEHDFSRVNKKAFDEIANVLHDFEKVQKGRETQEQSERSIKELIASLDSRKSDTLKATFDNINTRFGECFKMLVPQGTACLLWREKPPPLTQGATQEEDLLPYCGVIVRVTFVDGAPALKMQQLSGGQKTVVAMALIFAIQACEPAPFYLLDEIDAALDEQYRLAVASMIQESRQEVQYIFTTFRPELLHVADKFYGVSMVNQGSYVRELQLHEALETIKEAEPPLSIEA